MGRLVAGRGRKKQGLSTVNVPEMSSTRFPVAVPFVGMVCEVGTPSACLFHPICESVQLRVSGLTRLHTLLPWRHLTLVSH